MYELIFIVMAFIIYWKCINGGPVYDDPAVLSANIKKGMLWDSYKRKRGLVNLTFALTFRWFSASKHLAKLLHGFNILVHGINAGLLMHLMLLLGFGEWNAIFGALLWLVSPLATSAVANIAGRSSVMSTSFLLMGLMAALSGWHILFLPLMYIGILKCKNDVVMTFPLAGVILLMNHNPIGWIYLVLPFIFAAFYIPQLKRLRGIVLNFRTGWEPIFNTIDYTKAYLVESVKLFPKWFLGFGYCVSPDVERVTWKEFLLYGTVLLMVVLSLAIVPYGVQLAILLIILSPYVSYIAAPMPDVIMENRAYASLGGFSCLFGMLLIWLVGLSWWAWPLMGLWLFWLAFLSSERASKWAPFLLYESIIEEGSRKPMILLNRSSELINQRRLQEAQPLIMEALERCPNVYHGWANLATIHAMTGNGPAMLASYRRGAFRCPKLGMAWNVLGQAYQGQKRMARALCAFRRATMVEPDNKDYKDIYEILLERQRVVVRDAVGGPNYGVPVG